MKNRDANISKEELGMEIRTLESSVAMYEKTISEMKDRGATALSVEQVENGMKLVKDQLDDAREVMKHEGEDGFEKMVEDHFVKWNASTDPGGPDLPNMKIMEEMGVEDFYKFSPLFRHRFIIEFGTDAIPYYCVSSARYSDGSLVVKFRDCEEFFTPEFFDEHGRGFRGRTVRIFWLDQYMEKRAVSVLTGVKFVKYVLEPLDYADDNPQVTEVYFKYKNANHKRLNATDKKQSDSEAEGEKERQGEWKAETPEVRYFEVGGEICQGVPR